MSEFLYGRQAIREALRARRRQAHSLMVAKGTRDSTVVKEVLELSESRGCPVDWVDRGELNRFSSKHQGIVLEASGYPYVSLDDIERHAEGSGEPILLLALDHLEDPRNLGAILRTADAVGVHGVILPKQRSASVTPVASDTSAGAAEHLLVTRVTNMSRTLDQLKRAGIWAAGLESVDEAQSYRSVQLNGPMVVVVGSEGDGLSRLVREKCDWLLSLPMKGRVESLNASVAASIVLYWVLECRERDVT